MTVEYLRHTGPVRQGAHRPAAAPDSFIEGTFRNSAGARYYKLYVPPNPAGKRLPLVVMLHGCTQDADDFAAGTAMNDQGRRHDFYVLYPVQSREAHPQRCWNWFENGEQLQGRAEAALLAGMTREVVLAHGIDSQRVYIAGLSAGGAMAALVARSYPKVYAAAGVHSGLAPGVASDLSSATAAMQGLHSKPPTLAGSGIPVIVFHGDQDTTVHPKNALQIISSSLGDTAPEVVTDMPGERGQHPVTRHIYLNGLGDVIAERWEIHGAGHAWAGGSELGSCTDRKGPDATCEMVRFFLTFSQNASAGTGR